VKVLVVSGIWPPDVGGPASHAPELAEFLVERGHRVEAVITADARPAAERYPVHWIPRAQPAAIRYARGSALVSRVAAKADVVYATGMYGRSRVGTLAGRTPRVVKLTGDPAYERAARYGLTGVALDEFQRSSSVNVLWLKAMRDLVLAGADRYLCPSSSLAEIAAHWRLVDPERIEVLPNPVSIPETGDRDELRRRHGFHGPTLVFAGRLAPVKALDVALEALGRVDGVSLVVAGNGPERARLEGLAAHLGLGERVRFLGAQPRAVALELFAAGDAVLLTSTWENFPHAVVEGLAAGTPVIATGVGGVNEIVTDGVNGLLAPPGDPGALAEAIRRFFADDELRARLRGAARDSVDGYAPERVYGRIEELLEEAAA
jgi:glycosyltransferase involved in cell wall biosynthesis